MNLESPVSEKQSDVEGRFTTHQPMILLFVVISAGIIIDSTFGIGGLGFWAIVVVASLVSWIVCFRRGRMKFASFFLLSGCLGVGGLWHHAYWRLYPADEISLFATELPKLATVEAIALNEPRWILNTDQQLMDPMPTGVQTRLLIQVARIRNGTEWIKAHGQATLTIRGQISGANAGDRLVVTGKLTKTRLPRNPGEFDFRNFYRSKRQLCRIHCSHPDGIQIVEPTSGLSKNSLLSNLRRELDRIIWRHIQPENAPLASAILVGNRQQVSPLETRKFMTTGTVHLLAISGLHVGILSLAILILNPIGLLPRRMCLALTILFVFGYAWLVEFRAPVLRAAILISLYCWAKWNGRSAFSFNTLALAGLIVIAFNPAQLFQTGAQLSFLAVGTLAVFSNVIAIHPTTDPLDRLIERSRPWPIRSSKAIWKKFKQLVCISGVIWIVATPMIASTFHLVAPIALLVNPFLMLPISIALFSGFIMLIFGWLIPPLSHAAGEVCNSNLSIVNNLVEAANAVPAGHWWTAGPTQAAVLVFYVGFAMFWVYPLTRLPFRWKFCAAATWLATFVALPGIYQLYGNVFQDGTSKMSCTFIDVGHGGSVLMQMPGNRNVLYDAGSFVSSRFAAEKIAGVLWSSRVAHLDAVVISHADVDHFNGLPQLLNQFSVGSIIMSRETFYHSSPIVQSMIQSIQAKNIPIDLVSVGDKVVVNEAVDLEVLNPPAKFKLETDNASSIILQVRFGSQGVLLTGDVELSGLDLLLAQEMAGCTVAMAPHHGSRNSRPAEFSSWAKTRAIVICDGVEEETGEQVDQFRQFCQSVFVTGRDGAVRCDFENNAYRVRNWLNEKW